MTAIVSITLREHGEQRLRDFAQAIDGFDEVQSAWHTTGEEDFILRVIVTDMAQYDFVVHRLSTIPTSPAFAPASACPPSGHHPRPAGRGGTRRRARRRW